MSEKPEQLAGKVVIIIGAGGGLAQAFARTFAHNRARVILAARNPVPHQTFAASLAAPLYQADVTEPQSLQQLAESVIKTYGKIDIVVNATGVSYRKELNQMSFEELQMTLNTNLLGTILVTQAFLPQMQKQGYGTIVHLGGYADGRLALPYHSVDVASRAGMFSFVEAINREVANPAIMVQFFSPSPAQTTTEEPYHAMWRELKQPIVSVEQVAEELVAAIRLGKPVYIMGGVATRLFAKLNSIWPTLADKLLLNRYWRVLRRYLVK